jgi:phage shock protein PspC (stress-responsive transcriptional regulator)
MKKTHTANISGTVFHIEEDAYETLQRYLANIRAQFAGTDGREEIMADIEARIAELLHERLDGRRQVVSIADVEHIVSTMGQPEDFSDGEDAATENTTAKAEAGPAGRARKRLFRDPDDKWLGGVLGGLAAYIGMEALWLRIAMIVLVWASVGVLIPMYILLWILVPKADNATERLQMRGEAVTVDNIKRVVEEGAEKVKEGGERFAKEAENLGRNWTSQRRKSQAAEIVTKLVGAALLIFAFSALLSLITALIGGTFSLWHSTWSSEDVGLLDLGGLLFNSQQHALWFIIGAFALVAIPIIGLFLAGFRLLLDRRTPKWLGWTLCILWTAALVPTVIGAADLGREFHRENSVRTTITLADPKDDVLYIDALNPADDKGNWSVRFDDGDIDVDLDGLHMENGMITGAWARLDVERSLDTLYHLRVVREANGRTAKDALFRAERIAYDYRQDGDALLVSPLVRYAAADKFRGQDVQFTLEVPLGKSIFLRAGSDAVIYDIRNVNNTFDSDMLGRTWTMTERGLIDPNAPLKIDKDEKDGDDGRKAPAPPDTVRAPAPIAASVFRGPAKRKVPARAEQGSYELPSLLALIKPHK